MLLALDTATRNSGLALFDGRQLVAELNWRSDDGQTTELMPRLAQLLAWHRLEPAALRVLAVSLGPGSFTGLRVAVSAAKGMALAHGLPLIGVPTLDATALPFVPRIEPVCAVVQAGRGRICWAIYAAQSEPVAALAAGDPLPVQLGGWAGWRTPYHLSDIAALAAKVQVPTLFAGELSEPSADELATMLAERAIVASPGAAPRRAAALAYLGWARWQAGDVDDAASLSPIYLREP